MRVFKSKKFAKFAEKEKISDTKLYEVANNMASGKIDADLGGYVFKQRIAREGRGKSGGYRVIILYRVESRLFFVHGFSKSDEDNITEEQERDFKKLASFFLELPDKKLAELVKLKELVEVTNDEN